MKRRLLLKLALLLLLLEAGGCRSFDHYSIELRDAESDIPVQGARIMTRYGFEEMFRVLRWGKPKSFDTTTDADGSAEIRVEPRHSWWFQIEVLGRPMHSVHFNSDGTLNESLGRTERHDGWISLRQFDNRDTGSLEASVALVKKAQ